MFKDELKKFVEDNPKLVSMKPAGEGLFVLKYKRSVFYNNLWNSYLEECRGTIVDQDFNVVSRPFTKIYNYGIEAKAPKLADDVQVTAYRKVNGFMVAMTWYNNDILVSTTGSTDSDYVTMAKEMMLKHAPWPDWQMEISAGQGMTYMFECVHPNDPHIVVEQPGMYFLGVRENTWDSKIKMYGNQMADWARNYAMSHLKCHYPESLQTTVGDLVELSKKVQHEGFVFYTEDGRSAKIKSPHYLVSKFVARNPRTEKLMDKDIKNKLDEEYYPLIDAIQADIDAYTAKDEQGRLAWVREFLEN